MISSLHKFIILLQLGINSQIEQKRFLNKYILDQIRILEDKKKHCKDIYERM